MLKKYAFRYILGAALVLVFLGHASELWPLPFVNFVDHYLYDVRMRLAARSDVDTRIVIVDIDEKSLAEVGRWPWGRDKVGELVSQLTDRYKAPVVGFDVVFAEPDRSSGLPVLEQLAKNQLRENKEYLGELKTLRSKLDYDAQFVDILKSRPVVLGYYFSNQISARKTGVLPPPSFSPETFAGREIGFIEYDGFGSNLAMFQQVATASGHFNPVPDEDGISRRVPMLAVHAGNYYESLSLATLRVLLNNAPIRPVFADKTGGMEWLDILDGKRVLQIPVDRQASTLVPFRGGERSFPYVSAVDVLRGDAPERLLTGKIVLVGTTAPGLMDLRATPFGPIYPGVEMHANIVAGVLEGNLKYTPSYGEGVVFFVILVVGGLLVFWLPRVSPVRATLLAGGALVVVAGGNVLLWRFGNLVLPLAGSLIMILLLYGLDSAWGYFFEARTKRQLTGLFGQYVPPELVDEMARDPENYSMEGKKENLTVLFSDVRSFTTISEGLDSKELTQLMNTYLGEMTQVIRQYRGTLDKYIGDAIMAFWGAPVQDAEHARQAVLAALAMQRALRTLDASFKARSWPELHIGIGINTGSMTVGDMGSPVRQAYTVMGDAVNLGSRLESLTKQYGVGIMVGETTRAAVDEVVFRELDRVRVKGKDKPVAVFEPVGLASEVEPAKLEELQLWNRALDHYRSQHWDAAEADLVKLIARAPDCRLYVHYSERVAYYRRQPPGEQWDGVTTFETK